MILNNHLGRALLIVALATVSHAEDYLSLNLGITSRSVLGLSYTSGRNVFNAGLLGFGVRDGGEYLLTPTISYNRYFTDNGWYGLIGYAQTFRNEDVATTTLVVAPDTYLTESHKKKRVGMRATF